MKTFVSKALIYIGIGVLAVPLSIVSHELGHFLFYIFFGASNVQLHSVSVSADKDALSGAQLAVVNIVGPVISYLTIALTLVLCRKRYIAHWIILGLAAPIGRIVNFIYVYFRALGYNPNPNFDEFNFSRNIGVDPIWFAAATCLIVIATFTILLSKVWKAGGLREIILIIVSLASGLVVWSLFGGVLLP